MMSIHNYSSVLDLFVWFVSLLYTTIMPIVSSIKRTESTGIGGTSL